MPNPRCDLGAVSEPGIGGPFLGRAREVQGGPGSLKTQGAGIAERGCLGIMAPVPRPHSNRGVTCVPGFCLAAQPSNFLSSATWPPQLATAPQSPPPSGFSYAPCKGTAGRGGESALVLLTPPLGAMTFLVKPE
jgi:hypothetical protein